jgi:acetylornithine deacetylase
MSVTAPTALLRDLVALPSINPMGRTLPEELVYEHRVTAYLDEFFADLGVRYQRQPVAEKRENIVAYYQSPGAQRTYVWEVHQDTVPIDNMIVDPFGAHIEAGRLYGRGACDIKGGMAAMLSAFARLVRDKPAGAANIIMACTVDEEFTFLGVQKLVETLKADGAIVAEPTQLHIVKAHKGVVRWNLLTAGRACHSSSPQRGINAIYRMARLLVGIEQYAEHLQQSRSDPLLGTPTISVGRIEGGTSANTVPDRCRVEIDRRVLPGEEPDATPDDLDRFLREQVKIDFPYEMQKPWLGSPPLSAEGSAELVARLGRAIKAVRGPFEEIGVPFGTDASTIARAGIPAVVFGPGDVAQAHTCDEWVPLDEVAQASDILYRFACEG